MEKYFLYGFVTTVIVCLLWGCKGDVETTSVKATERTCEYLVNPLSMDAERLHPAREINRTETAKRG
jgi:hypothetical protein